MNFDRFNPLSSYLSNNGVEVSDWGIEESTTMSSPTLSNQNMNFNSNPNLPPPPSLNHLISNSNSQHPSAKHFHHYGLVSPSSIYPIDQVFDNRDFMYYYAKYNPQPLVSSTENIDKFIKKYLCLNNVNGKFVERFKYNLIISDLLDDSMILSKNEASLNTLMLNDVKNSNSSFPTLIRDLNHDGTELLIYQKKFRLKFPDNLSNPSLILTCISLIIFLLKQNLKNSQSKLSHASKLKMFKILLIAATKLINYKRINSVIQSKKILNLLNEFLISNYKINKKLIVNLINLKELDLFKFMNPKNLNSAILKHHIEELKHHLDYSLSFLIFNLKNSIIKISPFLNGEILEKYCHVNNIDINNLLLSDFDEEIIDDSLNDSQKTIYRLTIKMNKLNQLRKLLISQLLTFNEPFHKNFFLCKLWDHFNINETEIHEINKNITFFEKLNVLENIFNNHNSTVNNFNMTFENFEKLAKMKLESFNYQNPKNEDLKNQNILKINNDPSEITQIDESNINNLISKLSNLTTNLKFFKKYSNSISNMDNIDEFNEKLMIFNQFNEEINLIKEIYQSNLNDLQNELYHKFDENSNLNSPSSSISQKHKSNSSIKSNPDSNQPFNLKSFHTTSSNSNTSTSIKKRFSLPAHTNTNKNITPASSPIIPQTPDSSLLSKYPNSRVNDGTSPSLNSNDKKYKRLSTGLQLGLLTVFEEPDKNGDQTRLSTSSTHRRTASNTSIMSASANKLDRPASIHPNNDKRTVSYDDNYINILPPNNYETYNQATFDSLTKRINLRNSGFNNSNHNSNRFSMNSLNSNISGLSDLLTSTQITSFDDDDGTVNGNGIQTVNNAGHLSKEELKSRLEESFNRIYNLEHENETLKSRNNTNDSNIISPDSTINKPSLVNLNSDHIAESSSNDVKNEFLTSHNDANRNHTFLNQLEEKLNNKVESGSALS